MHPLLHRAHAHVKRHYEKHYKTRYQERAHLVFLLDSVLVSIALALLAVGCYFRWSYHPLRDDFQLSLLTDREITAGKETTFAIRVVNGGKTSLHDARMSVRLPTMFVPDAVPAAYDATSGGLEIGNMDARASYQYRFRGFLFGPAQAADLYVRFTAQNDAGKSDEKLTQGELRWNANAIETRLEMPGAVIPGQAASFKLHVKNGSAFAFDRAEITPSFPAGFRLQNATPPLYRGVIALGRLEPGEEDVLEFSGRFIGGPSKRHFETTLFGDIGNRHFTLSNAQSDVRLADAGLKLDARFDGAAPPFVQPGQDVPVIVRYRNAGAQTIKNLTLSLEPDAADLGAVRWETSPVVGDLAPGESGERKATLHALEKISPYATNPLLRASPQATFSIENPPVQGALVTGDAVETKVAGTATLRAAARYFTTEGDQIGRGPLPPKVGQTTRYWIFASLETGASATENGLVSFRLPPGVAWTGRATVTSGEDLLLVGDRLIWRLGATDAHAGALIEAPSASFEIALTPSAEQAGTAPALLEEASFTGQDAWTGTSLTSSFDGLTTRLPGDPAVAGRALIQPSSPK